VIACVHVFRYYANTLKSTTLGLMQTDFSASVWTYIPQPIGASSYRMYVLICWHGQCFEYLTLWCFLSICMVCVCVCVYCENVTGCSRLAPLGQVVLGQVV
jgi:hypothetical protein